MNHAKVFFQRKEYDAQKLVNAAALGYVDNVPNHKINSSAANSNMGQLVAIQFEGTYHLLTGCVNPASSTQALRVITKHVLAKALIEPETYADRQAASKVVYRPGTRQLGPNWGTRTA